MKKVFLIGSIALIFGFFGCNLGGNDNPPSPPSAAVLFATLSPDAPGVNINLGTTAIAGSMPYGKYTPYAQVNAGATSLTITDATEATKFLDADVSLLEGSYYSAFLIDSAKKMKVALIKDELATVSTDSVRIRFFNFSPNSSAVDLAIDGGDVLSANRNFNDQDLNPASKTFTRVKAGSYKLEIKQAGTSNIVVNPVLFTFEGGGTYSIFIKGFVGGAVEKSLAIGTIRHL